MISLFVLKCTNTIFVKILVVGLQYSQKRSWNRQPVNAASLQALSSTWTTFISCFWFEEVFEGEMSIFLAHHLSESTCGAVESSSVLRVTTSGVQVIMLYCCGSFFCTH